MRIGKTYFMVPRKEREAAVAFYPSVFGLEPAHESGEWTEIPHGKGVSIALHRGELAARKMGWGSRWTTSKASSAVPRPRAAG